MDEKFQDRIDNYLLNRMEVDEKEEFLHEVKQDVYKKEQLEFTQNVKDSICSREEKLRALTQFQQQYEEERKATAMHATGTVACSCLVPKMEEKLVQSKKKIWLWISGVAAVLVVGIFAIKLMFVHEYSPNYNRGLIEHSGDEVFSPAQMDITDNDTIKLNIENEVTPDE